MPGSNDRFLFTQRSRFEAMNGFQPGTARAQSRRDFVWFSREGRFYPGNLQRSLRVTEHMVERDRLGEDARWGRHPHWSCDHRASSTIDVTCHSPRRNRVKRLAVIMLALVSLAVARPGLAGAQNATPAPVGSQRGIFVYPDPSECTVAQKTITELQSILATPVAAPPPAATPVGSEMPAGTPA